MKKLLLAISGVLLALGALIASANAQQASSAFILSSCGTLPAGVTYAAGQFGILTMDTTGKLCDSATGGGGGGGAVFGPTAAGSAAANPPVIVGGTADGTATGNVVNWKVLAGIGYINCANCSGSGVSSVDEVAFVAGTSLFAGTGGFFQTTATSNALTNGQQGMFQVTANRALFSNLRNAAGAEIGVAAAPVQVSLANTAANAAAVLVNQPTGTNLHAVLDTTSTTAVTQATGTNLHAVLDTTSTTAVTQATGTNLHSVVDSGTITTVTSLSQQTGWAGGTLGAMANYGTSPGAVLVPGVNAFITNTNANGQAVAANSSPVVLPAAQVTVDPCALGNKTNLPISQTGTSSVQLVGLSGSTVIYVCSIALVAGGATTVVLTTGTGTACVTGNAAVIGDTTANVANGLSFAANGGYSQGNGAGTIAKGAASSELCMTLGTNVRMSGNLTYVQQ